MLKKAKKINAIFCQKAPSLRSPLQEPDKESGSSLIHPSGLPELTSCISGCHPLFCRGLRDTLVLDVRVFPIVFNVPLATLPHSG
jgi:hypothetical protein